MLCGNVVSKSPCLILVGRKTLFGNPHAVWLVQLIPVNPAVNLSGGNLGIPGVNLINESCWITSIKGQYIQKNSPPDS